jgi:hypothetical protein
MASCVMIYLPSFMKSGTDIQAILRFCLRNLNGCNIGIIDGCYEVCRLYALMCTDIHIKIHKDWFSHSEIYRRDPLSPPHTGQGDLISLHLFFQNKGSRLIMYKNSVRTSKEILYISARKTNRLTLFIVGTIRNKQIHSVHNAEF